MDKISAILKEHFGKGAKIERNSDYDQDGMTGYDIDGEVYIIGDYDTAYEAAVKEAIRAFEDCYTDDDKVDWLEKYNWPGLDEEEVIDSINSDFDEPIYDSFSDYIDEFGKASDAFNIEFLRPYINMRELGEFIVDTDGIANGLARYDGEEIEIGDYLAYRVE